jgi:hypothetical protein
VTRWLHFSAMSRALDPPTCGTPPAAGRLLITGFHRVVFAVSSQQMMQNTRQVQNVVDQQEQHDDEIAL